MGEGTKSEGNGAVNTGEGDGKEEDDNAGAGTEIAPGQQSFAMAANVGLDPPKKQQVLQMRSENERLQFLIEHLDGLLPVLRNKVELQKRVKSNGHPWE